mmetsp:Transcript_42031/g.64390  ORF Transcript_42031/g.64390 Transcript_42031/m.64390 type:complete len:99 (-) Transcript_42031:171-467(-)
MGNQEYFITARIIQGKIYDRHVYLYFRNQTIEVVSRLSLKPPSPSMLASLSGATTLEVIRSYKRKMRKCGGLVEDFFYENGALTNTSVYLDKQQKRFY